MSGRKYIFLVLYVANILLASYDIDLLVETNQFMLGYFDMKDLGEVSYVLGIKILHNRPSGILRLSQEIYIECILKMFNMYSCSSIKAPAMKGNKFSKC